MKSCLINRSCAQPATSFQKHPTDASVEKERESVRRWPVSGHGASVAGHGPTDQKRKRKRIMNTVKIYLASSWRNIYQPQLLKTLRDAGHEVYDFRNPNGDTGFHWSEIDPKWKDWTPAEYVEALEHPVAQRGYGSDKDGMDRADVCVLLLPCGLSAHIEAGYMIGQGKPCFIYVEEKMEPELIYKLGTVVTSFQELLAGIQGEYLITPDRDEDPGFECPICKRPVSVDLGKDPIFDCPACNKPVRWRSV